MQERVFAPKWGAPKDAILNPYEIHHRGIVTWKNRRNGFMVAAVHYTADPEKRSLEWFQEATKLFRTDQIEREFEIDFDSRAGQKVFRQLAETPKRWRIPNIDLDKLVKSRWRIIAALDYGTTNPTSIHFYAIDEARRFYSVFEFYKPSNVREIAKVLKGEHPEYRHPLWRKCERVVVDSAIFNANQDTGGEGHDSIGDLLEAQGIYTLERADKSAGSRLAGLERIKDMLAPSQHDTLPSLFFCERCKNQWAELLGLVYDELPPHLLLNKNQKEDVVAKNDHCFVAGTMLETPSGVIPIEKIKMGDLVLTRKGFRPVLAGGPTRIAQTYTLKFDNNCEIKCTGNHPIWTENRGWIRADELSYADICVTNLPNQKQLFSTGLNFAAIQTLRNRAIENILSAARNISTAALDFFTERFGNFIMAPSPMATMSTTKMEILSITTFPIWNAFAAPIIFPNTGKLLQKRNQPHGERTDLKQKNGTLPRKEENGTEGTLKMFGRKWKPSNLFARFAAKNSKPHPQRRITRSFALLNAGLGLAAKAARTILRSCVEIAGRLFPKAGLPKRKPVAVYAASLLERNPSKIAQVYNLSVGDRHEYFANGILASNSYDELRYALMSVESPSNLPPPPKPGEGTLGSVEKEMDLADNEEQEVDYL